MEMLIDFPGGVRVDAHFNGFTVRTDQPVDDGGDNSAPTPFDIFLSSIGTCAGFYVLNFCCRRGLPVEGIRLIQRVQRNEATRLVEALSIEIQLPADFPARYKAAVIRAAELCTVKKHFDHPPEINVAATIVEPASV
jgi:putative redox protein